MSIRRVVPIIVSGNIEATKRFYLEFLGFHLVMDMDWIITFASPSNPTAQINVVVNQEKIVDHDQAITIEVDDVDQLYEKALEMKLDITKNINDEPWGARRFFVKDPNGVIINVMNHSDENP